MTLLREREQTVERRMMRFTTEWVVGLIGALAAAVGAWMYHAPTAGELQFFGWTWDVTDLAEYWPLSLLVGGGVLMCIAFASVSRRLFLRDGEMSSSSMTSAILSIAALALAVVYGLIWIL